MCEHVIVLPEKMFLASLFVQTNTLLDSQTTHTHPSPHQPNKQACTPGVSVSIICYYPHHGVNQATKLCLCWSHRVKTVLEEFVFCGATRYNSRPGQDARATRNRKTWRDARHQSLHGGFLPRVGGVWGLYEARQPVLRRSGSAVARHEGVAVDDLLAQWHEGHGDEFDVRPAQGDSDDGDE